MLSSQMLCLSSWSFCVAFIASPLRSFESWRCRKQATQIAVEQVSNTVHADVGCGEGGERLCVVRVLSLSRKNGCHAHADVEARYPALHYVLVDDKPQILA